MERMLIGEWGKGMEILGKKIKIFKNGGWEEYQLVGNFIHPCFEVTVDDTLIHSKLSTNTFPNYDQMVQIVGKTVDGHQT